MADDFITRKRDEARALKEEIARQSEIVAKRTDLSDNQRAILNSKLLFAEAHVNLTICSL